MGPGISTKSFLFYFLFYLFINILRGLNMSDYITLLFLLFSNSIGFYGSFLADQLLLDSKFEVGR